MTEGFNQGGVGGSRPIDAPGTGADPITVYDYEKAASFVKSRLFVAPSVNYYQPPYLSWLPRRV